MLEHGVVVALAVALPARVAEKLVHGEGDDVAHGDSDGERLVESVGDADTHADCDVDTVNVGVSEGDAVPHCDRDSDGVAETHNVIVADVDTDAVEVSVSEGDVVPHGDSDGDRVLEGDRETDSVNEIDSIGVREPDRDARDGDVVGVDPAGAQNGPMLNVERCVPARDANGDADLIDGDPVGVEKPVAAEGDCDDDEQTESEFCAVDAVDSRRHHAHKARALRRTVIREQPPRHGSPHHSVGSRHT